MNWYKKINNYLLTQFPLLWNTGAFWVLSFGILLNIIFYFFGYQYITIEFFQRSYINSYSIFSNSAFSFIYGILVLLAFIYFGVQYFSFNPIRALYPVSKWYFWRYLLVMFVVVAVYVVVPYTFLEGVKHKTKIVIPPNLLQSQVKAYNDANPWLVQSIDNYNIEYRCYPPPFPLDQITQFENPSNSNKLFIHLDKPYVYINGKATQFVSLKTIYKDKDSCESETVIDSFYNLSERSDLAEFSIRNFSGFYSPGDEFTRVENDSLNNQKRIDIYMNNVYDIMDRHDTAKISKSIEALKSIADFYGVIYDINTQHLVFLLDSSNYDIDYQMVAENPTGYANDAVDYAETEVVAAPDAEEMEYHGAQKDTTYQWYLNKSQLVAKFDSIYRMENDLGYKELLEYPNLIYISISIILALVFFAVVKVVNIVDILIGIVIGGVLILIISLLLYLIYSNGSEEKSMFAVIDFYCFLIFGIAFSMTWRNYSPKKVVTYLIPAGITALFCGMVILYFNIQNWTDYELVSRCGNLEVIHRIEIYPIIILFIVLLCTGVTFFWLRKWRSLPE